jgi:SAM-dependent MidA family methyltransferase
MILEITPNRGVTMRDVIKRLDTRDSRIIGGSSCLVIEITPINKPEIVKSLANWATITVKE